MAKTLWLPNVERIVGPHRLGGTMAGGPPRAVHHITWDALNSKGERPRFKNVSNYLVHEGYEPHLMIDPILGTAVQFMPFNRAAYALRNLDGGVDTNREGSACIQVEWFFSPNCVVNGKRYETLKDTPMKGLDTFMALCEEYGIPAEWPMGEPTWRSHRTSKTWESKAGHYGHCHVPENTHNDPGPMALPAAAPIQTGDPLVATQKELDYIVSQVVAKLGAPRPADHSDPDKRYISLGDVLTGAENASAVAQGALLEAITTALDGVNNTLNNLGAAVQELSMSVTEALSSLPIAADSVLEEPTPEGGTPA